jgi:hypothetical protein
MPIGEPKQPRKRCEDWRGEAGSASNHGKPAESKTKSLEEMADGKDGFSIMKTIDGFS